MENSSSLKVCSYSVHLAAIFVAMFIVGCGSKPYQPPPKVEITSANFETHAVGGPNSYLLCELGVRYQTGGQELEIVETVGDKSFVPFGFTGSGMSQVPIRLMGTFVNDGDTSRMEELLEQLPGLVHRPTSMSPGETIPFLEYEGLDGTPVRYELRLR